MAVLVVLDGVCVAVIVVTAAVAFAATASAAYVAAYVIVAVGACAVALVGGTFVVAVSIGGGIAAAEGLGAPMEVEVMEVVVFVEVNCSLQVWLVLF